MTVGVAGLSGFLIGGAAGFEIGLGVRDLGDSAASLGTCRVGAGGII